MINLYNCYSAMRVLSTSVLATGVLLTSSIAFAGERIDRTLDSGATPKLDIEHVNGNTDIKVWDKPQVRVVGELSDRTEEFIFEVRGDVVIIHVEVNSMGKDWWEKNDEGDTLTIYVPTASDVNYSAVNADVTIEGVTQSASIDVVNGDVDITNTGKRVKASSVNGDINLSRVYGRLDADTINGEITATHEGQMAVSFASVNGRITATTSSPDVTVETVNGQSTLSLQSIDSLSINTVNGRSTASLNLNPDGQLKANSVGGKIDLTFQPNVSAQFDIEAHAGGDIDNRISDDKVGSPKFGPSKWLRFMNNGGAANVDISTVHGTIVIDQQ
ncbi:DUF4097 family beta strand repeat-containing protein [Alteromonas profundi]|nr:hypothetical protein [Alteromonas profundi]